MVRKWKWSPLTTLVDSIEAGRWEAMSPGAQQNIMIPQKPCAFVESPFRGKLFDLKRPLSSSSLGPIMEV